MYISIKYILLQLKTSLFLSWAKTGERPLTKNKPWLHMDPVEIFFDAPKLLQQKDSKVINANEAAVGQCLPKSIWAKIIIVYSLQKTLCPCSGLFFTRKPTPRSYISCFFWLFFVLSLSISTDGINCIIHLWSVTFRTVSNLDYFKCKVPVSAVSVPEEPKNVTH